MERLKGADIHYGLRFGISCEAGHCQRNVVLACKAPVVQELHSLVAPPMLNRIQLRGMRRQKSYLKPWVLSQKFLHRLGAVHRPFVQIDNDSLLRVPVQQLCLEEADECRSLRLPA